MDSSRSGNLSPVSNPADKGFVFSVNFIDSIFNFIEEELRLIESNLKVSQHY